jgi:lipoyl(octanoyl) transferase
MYSFLCACLCVSASRVFARARAYLSARSGKKEKVTSKALNCFREKRSTLWEEEEEHKQKEMASGALNALLQNAPSTTATTKTLGVRIFQSLVPYARAQALQNAIHEARKNQFVPDVLLILQHPSVVTVGKRAEVGMRSIKTEEEKLRELKCEVVKSDRGGDVTYHGPGQIVVYPIIHLREKKLGARKYVEKLENVMIEVAKKYGISNARGQMKNEKDGSDMSGVWVGKKKLGAVGVKISGGVTSHGFALNSETDLEFFREHILPCGLEGMDVTSLKDLTGKEVTRERVEVEIVDAFAKEYGYTEVYTRRC